VTSYRHERNWLDQLDLVKLSVIASVCFGAIGIVAFFWALGAGFRPFSGNLPNIIASIATYLLVTGEIISVITSIACIFFRDLRSSAWFFRNVVATGILSTLCFLLWNGF